MVGEIVVAAGGDRLEMAEAVAVRDGRVAAVGDRDSIIGASTGARIIDARGRAVIPGLHDAHLHLVDLARTRREIDLAPAADFGALLDAVATHVSQLPPDGWVLGRGWSADSLDATGLDRLEACLAGRPAFLRSRDGHSAWASAAALRLARVSADTSDPVGGRIERRTDGTPNGIVREKAVELIRPIVPRLRGTALDDALRETTAELRTYGITGVTDAGDFAAESGAGRYAALGDSFSALADAIALRDGGLRVTANVPMAAVAAAARLGLRTALSVDGSALRMGWVKLFADGALGSRTAALFDPYSCDSETNGLGLMTLSRAELDETIAAAHAVRIGVAVHAIGDRANAEVLDALERASSARDAGRQGSDRLEHAQLVRSADRGRVAALGVVASMQPVHCLSDREQVDRCWSRRAQDAYAWRSLAEAGVPIAFGSDAPVESVDPWAGMQAAVHRRWAGEPRAWQPEQRISFAAALSGYTLGPAGALGASDEGHLRVGARADLAVLNRPLRELVMSDDLVGTRAVVTIVDGRER